jgi:hypothetical protein
MSDSQNAGFGKFVPGFDFLQNLAKGASQAVPQMPTMSNWIAPSLNEEELDKRINELKAVHFWLDQNSKALGATVQALEVQKLTLATLKGMNLSMGDMANAFKFKAADTAATSENKAAEKTEPPAKIVADVADKVEAPAKKPEPAAKPEAPAAAAGLVDPMQLWTALTQQFQHIAAGAMKEAGKATTMDLGKNLAKGASGEASKTGKTRAPSVASRKVPSKKVPAKAVKKVAGKTTTRSR